LREGVLRGGDEEPGQLGGKKQVIANNPGCLSGVEEDEREGVKISCGAANLALKYNKYLDFAGGKDETKSIS
jgi:hypothetical protein